MKKTLITMTILLGLSSASFAANYDYYNLYNMAEENTTKFMHNVDPYQDEDYHRYAWSPYPLFRTSSYLYFKSITVEPGYYLITPRKINEKTFIFFKDNGKIKYVIPVVKTERTPIDFYKTKVPMPKKTKWDKFSQGIKNTFFKYAKDSKKVPPPPAFIETVDEGRFFIIKFYFGDDCHFMAFKKEKY